MAERVVGPDVDETRLASAVVDAHEEAAVGAAVDDVVVFGIDGDPAALAAGGGLPVTFVDVAAIAAAGDADGRIVLLSAVDAVGEMIVGGDAIELGGGLVVVGGP